MANTARYSFEMYVQGEPVDGIVTVEIDADLTEQQVIDIAGEFLDGDWSTLTRHEVK
jgi:hypothetical protein